MTGCTCPIPHPQTAADRERVENEIALALLNGNTDQAGCLSWRLTTQCHTSSSEVVCPCGCGRAPWEHADPVSAEDRDEALHARLDANWFQVLLRAREVQDATLRHLAQVWSGDREAVAAQLDKLAAVVDESAAVWDAALGDVVGDLGLPEAEVELTEQRARVLARELLAAADATFTARYRAQAAIPHQQNREAA